ncbi:unnamed protein product (macronuclear) [Paramecium tetraurelia]|uniref:Ammonium transporter AmtB-like domain-containing protein n=1 Tax=Paramecium tetraurelia TaxID=5888 RepID=A0DQP0_PARTE|nr:uncharacterized protein GSPATT00002757001 [Paramecium tetraurelia]CAK85357.1 unnamed protein product [Paramecium tetraurelia]|eukprot:XP_001452754.1 hypothetical protein (macronuclear) [Paramecium tetraurelia strain d4-2]
MGHLFRHQYANGEPPAIANIPAPQATTIDYDWILISGFIIVLTQVGFAFIEAGSVRYKNSQSIVIKVMLGLFLTILIWWLFGYGFSFGYDFQTNFMGGTKLGGYNWEANQYGNDYTYFVFRASGASIGVSVLSGAAAERMTFLAWSILTIVYAGFIYAGLAHWTLAQGWLKIMGFKDFSGAGVIFFAAGVAGLVLTVLLKPRRFRFDPNTNLQFSRHCPIYIAFGSILVFSGWQFYNGGVVAQGANSKYTQGLVAVNTMVAGATGGFFAFIIRYFQYETTSLIALSKGIISALVAVSAATDDIKSWTAFFYGLMAAGVYSVLAKAVPKHHIDDPVEVIPVFLGNGFLGIFLSAFFDSKAGFFYGYGGKLLGMQLFGLLIIFVWVAFFILITLLILKGFGVLRIDSETENIGIDKAYCQSEAITFVNQEDEVCLIKQTQLAQYSNYQIESRARLGFL